MSHNLALGERGAEDCDWRCDDSGLGACDCASFCADDNVSSGAGDAVSSGAGDDDSDSSGTGDDVSSGKVVLVIEVMMRSFTSKRCLTKSHYPYVLTSIVRPVIPRG